MRGGFVDHLTRAPIEVAGMKAGLAEQLRAKQGVFTLVTCQRIEVYSMTNPSIVDAIRFEDVGLMAHLNASAALAHLVCVGAGLRSQIVGELEIRAQFERAIARAAINQSFRELLKATLDEADGLRAKHGLSSAFGYDDLVVEGLLLFAPALLEGGEPVAVLGSGMLAGQIRRRLWDRHGVAVELIGQRDRYRDGARSDVGPIHPLRSWAGSRPDARARLLVVATDLTGSSRRLLLETLARSEPGHATRIVDFGAEPLLSEPVAVRRLPAGVGGYASMYDPWFQTLLDRRNSSRAGLLQIARASLEQATVRLSRYLQTAGSLGDGG